MDRIQQILSQLNNKLPIANIYIKTELNLLYQMPEFRHYF